MYNEIRKEVVKEEWLDIKGYEGSYQVSNYGNVRSLIHDKPKILKQYKNSNGYLRVCLSPSKKFLLVHRIVAQSFIENKNNYRVINHKDENRCNNNVSNLEWCTQSQNIRYSNVGVRINEKRKHKIKATNIKDGSVIVFESMREADRKGFNRKSIYLCLKGKYKNHKGYNWSRI